MISNSVNYVYQQGFANTGYIVYSTFVNQKTKIVWKLRLHLIPNAEFLPRGSELHLDLRRYNTRFILGIST